jgi:cytochrome c-type biogenesis protein CcmH
LRTTLAHVLRLAIAIGFVAFAAAAAAVQPDEVLPDAGQEARARTLSRELRCMVCQNQSIDDSEAALARDLRLLVRERIRAGDSDDQVISYLVARYGDFVLLKPPFKPQTLLLWLLPPLALLGGAIAVGAQVRRRQAAADTEPGAAALTPEEEARLAHLVSADQGTAPSLDPARETTEAPAFWGTTGPDVRIVTKD